MDIEMIFAGYGGQGALTMGKYIAEAGIMEGKNATWVPSYGQEKRGGDANSSVVLAEGEVVSPVVEAPTALLSMNDKAVKLMADDIIPGGALFYNSSMADEYRGRDDIFVQAIPCMEIASRLGSEQSANMILLGAYVEYSQVVRPESVEAVIRKTSKEKFVESNINAFNEGRKVMALCQKNQ